MANWIGLLPKIETGVAGFLDSNPDWDGRGIRVGILDTGVDPGAIGLTKTTTGSPKVIDMVDCSGSGDVKLGNSQMAVNNTIVGATGRILKLNPQWKNPTSTYRLGLKLAFELYPRGLKERVVAERKKNWSLIHTNIEANVKLRHANESTNDNKEKVVQLKSMYKDLDDCGPIFDCVVFHDGDRWQAVVDTQETGDLSSKASMSSYGIFQEFERFSNVDALNYAVNIEDEGAVLSIVVDAGAHGSHVAGIVAAYHADNPELNGMAPGAQIVSLKIGDTRLGSMETGASLMRALIEAVKRGCNIINLSYGEATAWDNSGEFVRQANKLVHEYGIIFVSSAGNNGPALSTVGSPGGTCSAVIGVGALVTPSLMSAAYSMPLPLLLPESNYTWSSMGPALDGAVGVSIIAPGGAVTSVPNWTLQRNQLMNGTSMSSPNACGCITLLLSAAKAIGLSVSPVRVRRAVENSAKLLPDVHELGQGHGLVQVPAAWELLQRSDKQPWIDVGYEIDVNSERFSRGIYLRQPVESSQASTFRVGATPIFREKESADCKIGFEVRCRLQSSASWVVCPDQVLMNSEGKQFNVQVDPRQLQLGGVHCATVRAFDDNHPELGCIFEIPVTVIRPEVIEQGVTSKQMGVQQLLPGARHRMFLVPPPGCQFIDAIVRDARNALSQDGESADGCDNSARIVVLHAVQVFRGTPYRDNEKESYITLTPGSEHSMSWAVREGWTVELVITRNWSTAGHTACDLALHFRGVTVVPDCLFLSHGQRVSEKVRVFSQLSDAVLEINPVGKLDKLSRSIMPTAAGKVTPLGGRDVLPDGTPLFQLILEYSFEVADAGTEILPRWPGLQGVLYESEFHGQFCMLYDGNKKLLGCRDAFPSAMRSVKGKHVLRLQVRHSQCQVLETLADMPVVLERTLQTAINLSFFKTQSEALVGTEKMKVRAVNSGGAISFYWREPDTESLPKDSRAGDVLSGNVTYIKKNGTTIGSGTKPGGYVCRYVLGDCKQLAASEAGDASRASVDTAETLLNTQVRDAKLALLKTYIGNNDIFSTIAPTVVADYPDNLTARQHVLAHAVQQLNSSKPASADQLLQVIADSDVIIGMVDQQELAAEFGVNVDKGDHAAVSRRKCAEAKKAALIEALVAKAQATLDEMSERTAAGASVTGDVLSEAQGEHTQHTSPAHSFEQVWQQLARWEDQDKAAGAHWQLVFGRHKLASNWALALKVVNDMLASTSTASSKEALHVAQEECLVALGWPHILDNAKSLRIVASKKEYDLF